MGMKASEIESYIKAAFPDADIEIRDLAGDDNHFAAVISSSACGWEMLLVFSE